MYSNVDSNDESIISESESVISEEEEEERQLPEDEEEEEEVEEERQLPEDDDDEEEEVVEEEEEAPEEEEEKTRSLRNNDSAVFFLPSVKVEKGEEEAPLKGYELLLVRTKEEAPPRLKRRGSMDSSASSSSQRRQHHQRRSKPKPPAFQFVDGDLERAQDRAVGVATTAGGTLTSTTQLFVRPRKRARLRKVGEGRYVPLYRLFDEGGSSQRDSRGKRFRSVAEAVVVVESAAGAVAAVEGGATRVDLAAPASAGEIKCCTTALAACESRNKDVPHQLFVRLKCPSATWRLDDDLAKAAVKVDVAFAKAAGASGVVLGPLDANGDVDADFVEQLVKLAKPLKVAWAAESFDLLSAAGGDGGLSGGGAGGNRKIDDPRKRQAAVELLCELGVSAIYATLSDTGSAWQGRRLIADVVHQARDRLAVVATGHDITIHTALKIAQATGVSQVAIDAKPPSPPRKTTAKLLPVAPVPAPAYVGGGKVVGSRSSSLSSAGAASGTLSPSWGLNNIASGGAAAGLAFPSGGAAGGGGPHHHHHHHHQHHHHQNAGSPPSSMLQRIPGLPASSSSAVSYSS